MGRTGSLLDLLENTTRHPCSEKCHAVSGKANLVIKVMLVRWFVALICQYDEKKLSNVYKSCLKMISVEKWLILTPLQKLPKNVGDLDKFIVAKGFQKLSILQ